MSAAGDAVELHDLSGLPRSREAARAFCLAVVAEVYGHGYRADWHADLDGLARGGAADWYAPSRRGRFLFALDEAGAIAATGGIHAVALKPALASRLAARYPAPEAVCQVARVYERADRRGRGIGTAVHRCLREAAARLGFRTLYLHAAARETGTLAFWRRQGYAAFGTVDYATTDGTETAVDFERACSLDVAL